ncbi:unnamed protein product [Owenia fusiformis]|uniref:Uncharacterized protein n=1 Tax=Owenia fusiformis TaxID=6347 RepID=A0A8J1XST4_OWEFU|nr:unnamed protein product [Owenia fusiformis]
MAEQSQQYKIPMPQLTKEELIRYQTKFKMFDRNKDGHIEARELAAVSKALGHNLSNEQINNIIGEWDLDMNGVLTFDEFVCCMHANKSIFVKGEQKKMKIRKMLISHAVDKAGNVPTNRMIQVLFEQLSFPPERSNRMLSPLDTQQTGHINLHIFSDFYGKVLDNKENLEKTFKGFDKDGSGAISLSSAQQVMKNFGFSNPQSDAMGAMHDRNRNGYFWYEELSQFWPIPQ